MTIVKPCTENDYLHSFFTRERNNGKWQGPIPPPEERKGIMLDKWPYKFPFKGERKATWHICRISTVKELKQLWMHKSGDWLENHDLWRGSNRLGELVKAALETEFFENKNNQCEGPYKNYYRWKDTGLQGQLDGHEKPMLVEEDNHIDILDGFGRLLPYLSLVCERKQFFPFRAYFAR